MINVVGLKSFGLPTALLLATTGQDVTCTDSDERLLFALKSGTYSTEADIENLLSRATDCGITFTDSCVKAEIYILCVPAPLFEGTDMIDATAVCDTISEILQICDEGATIIIETELDPGTIETIIMPMVSNKKIRIAYSPEKAKFGNLLTEIIETPRIIATDSDETGRYVSALYKSFVKGSIELTDIMPKYIMERIEIECMSHGIQNFTRVGLYGITSADDSDDITNSHTIKILERNPDFIAYDPYVSTRVVTNQSYDFMRFLDSVDMVVIMRGHKELMENEKLLKGKTVLDTLNICTLPDVIRL